MSETGNGIGFTGCLALLFIGLKLGHVIAWSWWWVLSPLWIPLLFVLTILFGTLIVAGIIFAIMKIWD